MLRTVTYIETSVSAIEYLKSHGIWSLHIDDYGHDPKRPLSDEACCRYLIYDAILSMTLILK
jgi:hypothetical protein